MARTNYTDDQKKAFVKAWMASGKPKSRWHREQVAAGNIEGHYNAFDQWVKLWQAELEGRLSQHSSLNDLDPAAKQEVVRHASTAYKALSGFVMGHVGKNPSLLAEFQQTLLPEDVQAKYIAFLEAKVTALTAELEDAHLENAHLNAYIGGLQLTDAQRQELEEAKSPQENE